MQGVGDAAPSPPRDAIVLDTNVVLDLWLFEDPRVAALSKALEAGQLQWLRTSAMCEELVHVLAHHPIVPAWAARDGRHPDDLRVSVAGKAQALSSLVPVEPAATPAPRCRDDTDQCFIDLAWSRRCAWLVSRDRAVLALRRRLAPAGIRVVPIWTPPERI